MMKTVLIFKKELKSYLTSPIYFLLAFVFTAFLSLRFLPIVFQFAQLSSMPAQMGGGANIHQNVFMVHLNLVYLILLFLTPLITMKLIAEEKKEKTIDLLLTSPVSSWSITMGKFFAAWFVVSLLLVLALLYPLCLALVADYDFGPLVGSYLGMFLMLGLNTSIGLFASSLTSSSLMAAFIGLLMTLGVMLSGSLSGSINHPFWSKLVEQLSLVLHVQDFFNGVLESSAFVFMFTTLFLFCFLTERVIESSRWR